MAVFVSKQRNPAIVIDGGGEKPVKNSRGEWEMRRFEELKIKFSDHKFDSSVFAKTHSDELERMQLTEEKLCEKIRGNPRFGGLYHEIKPPTKEEKQKVIAALKAQINELEGEARAVEETPEAQEEKKVYIEKCADCDWVAESSVSQSQAKSKLRGHRAAKHKKI